MKYVLLFVVAIILVKIDMVIELGEKTFALVKREEKRPQEDFGAPSTVVRSDTNVRMTPRQQYLNFLDSFKDAPILVYRERAMELFRKHPQMFAEKLDRDLEARIYSWRDLIVQNSAETPLFLLDLYNILKGENKQAVVRFFSVILDLNLEMFIANYPRTKDPACAPVTLIETAVPEEERVPELYERLGMFEEYLARENIPADRKLYATLCMNTLKIFIDKQAPAPAPVQEAAPVSTEQPAGTTP